MQLVYDRGLRMLMRGYGTVLIRAILTNAAAFQALELTSALFFQILTRDLSNSQSV